MALFEWFFLLSKAVFSKFLWGVFAPAFLVSFFVFGAWPIICSKIGLINKKSHLDLIKEIKKSIAQTDARTS